MNLGKKNKETVVTINNVTADKKACRRIDNDYYIIGDISIEDSGDCYYINEKYYRAETGYIVYDNEKSIYVIKNNTSIVYGVVKIDGKELILGYFTPAKYKNVAVYNNGNRIPAISEDIFVNNKYFRERLSDGAYYTINDLPATYFTKKSVPSRDMKRNLPYNCKDVIGEFTEDYNKYYNPTINSNIERYGDVVRDLSFGLEFETIKGIIPERLSKPLGLIPLRDGSIQGLEFVTIPLTGKKGLQTIVDSCNLLKERTEFDDSCALHLHIGGIPRTMEFILALYKTLVHIQDDVYQMFPLYKKYNFGVKRLDYSKVLPSHTLLSQMDKKINKDNIVDNFDVLFKYLSQGVPFKDNYNTLENVLSHPSDPRGNQKWNISTRYLWCNMIPLIFDNKQTVEFRIHTPTFEVDKVLNYVVFCSSIINFVKDNTDKILGDCEYLINRNLNNIIELGISNNSLSSDDKYRMCDSISRYINVRKQKVLEENAKGNIKGDESKISSYSRISWNNNIVDNKLIEKAGVKQRYGLQQEDLWEALNNMREVAQRPVRIREIQLVEDDDNLPFEL